MTDKCTHEVLKVSADVGRLSLVDGGPITHYTAEIMIQCAGCQSYFHFQGLPIGHNPYTATTSLDATELRVSLMPAGERVPEGLPMFSVNLPSTLS